MPSDDTWWFAILEDYILLVVADFMSVATCAFFEVLLKSSIIIFLFIYVENKIS